MDFILVQFLSGLASASSLFLVAVGLSIIFGVTRVVNFAHGSFYMLGAYVAWTLAETFHGAGSALAFWAALVLAALAVGAVGALVEVALLRRVYRAPELFQLLATFGVVLVVDQLVIDLWGPEELVGPRAPGLDGAVPVLGRLVPEYDLLLIALGPAVLGGLWLLFNRTRWGVLVRAATQDREMVAALGVNEAWLFTSVFALGAALAGLGGALQLPREAVSHEMDLAIIADVFVVTVIGGLGSVTGAFLAALLIGELTAFGIWIFPEITLVIQFLIMAVVLVVRPYGLLGKAEVGPRALVGEPLLRPGGRLQAAVVAAVAAVLLALPLVVGTYHQYLLVEVFALALFAASLHLIMGPGGMVSFGHAAYFGLGAYGAALTVKYLAMPMEGALLVAPLVAFAGALLFGWFCVRLSGVYLAMLSLAFAQIVYAITFQWYDFTGGDNGIAGVWPADWASSTTAYYYVALVLCGLGVLALRRVVFAPLGYGLRAVRDSSLRAEAIGIDGRRQQWFAFALAGLFAGLAGGVLAFLRGSIDTTWLAIPQSVDALVMVLLGGVQTLAGPLVGAALYHALEIWIATLTDQWPLVLGLIIIGLCVAFPSGVVGFAKRFARTDAP